MYTIKMEIQFFFICPCLSPDYIGFHVSAHTVQVVGCDCIIYTQTDLNRCLTLYTNKTLIDCYAMVNSLPRFYVGGGGGMGVTYSPVTCILDMWSQSYLDNYSVNICSSNSIIFIFIFRHPFVALTCKVEIFKFYPQISQRLIMIL